METLKNKSMSLDYILLAESNFSRSPGISYDQNLKHITDFKIEVGESDEGKTQIALGVDYKIETENKESLANAFIKYVGVFEISKELDETSKNKFIYINAPAILFPYVREQLSGLCVKAHLGAILMPPVNFVRMHEERKKDSE